MDCLSSINVCNIVKCDSRILLLFLRGESFDGTTVGMASQSSMCTKDRSGGVNVVRLFKKSLCNHFHWLKMKGWRAYICFLTVSQTANLLVVNSVLTEI